uniref:Orf144 n=1 Tax=Spizellomyces punctatus TaxID=109760 RepID=Q950S9_SPIPN|nr:orf144 [Spizellomyces punctatus]AAK84229.1 orf144 [Spizellomyces punctatus]
MITTIDGYLVIRFPSVVKASTWLGIAVSSFFSFIDTGRLYMGIVYIRSVSVLYHNYLRHRDLTHYLHNSLLLQILILLLLKVISPLQLLLLPHFQLSIERLVMQRLLQSLQDQLLPLTKTVLNWFAFLLFLQVDIMVWPNKRYI